MLDTLRCDNLALLKKGSSSQLTHDDVMDGSEFPSEGWFRMRTRFVVVESSAFIGENEHLDRSNLSCFRLVFASLTTGLLVSSKSNCRKMRK